VSEREPAGGINRNALIAPTLRIVYVPTPKIACTSIKWALAEKEGSPRPRSRSDISGEQTRELTIHNQAVNGLTTLETLSRSDREALLRDPTWIRFCVVRDPYERLISGWVDRVLLGRLGDVVEPALLRSDEGSEAVALDIGTMFRDTVRRLSRSEDTGLLADRHFRPQRQLLEPDTFPYTHIVNLAELDDFSRVIAESDPARAGLAFERRNAGIRFGPDQLYDRGTAEIVDDLFVDDFEAFGFSRRCFLDTAAPVPLSRNELSMIQMIRSRNERVDDLSAVARGQRRPRSRFQDRVRRVRRRLDRR
jgi:hypothetical protein